MEIALEKFSKQIKVSSYECNVNKEIKISCIFQHFSEIAWEHIKITGYGFEGDENSKYKWVLIKVFVNITKIPKWEDVLTIKTWPTGIKANFFNRDFVIEDSDSNELVYATSEWAVVDKTLNCIVVPVELEFFRQPKHQSSSNFLFNKIRNYKNLFPINKETAGFTDIDLHKHVNNSVYVRWIENCIGNIHPRRINSFKIHYVNEVFENDEVVIFGERNDNNMFYEGQINGGKLCFKSEVNLY